MITNERIIDAYLCLLDKHRGPNADRQLRELRPADFDRIRNVKARFDALWKAEQAECGQKESYYQFRVRTLNRWQLEYNWSDQTRRLYASVIAKLANWNRNDGKLSEKDKARLKRMKPGAMPLLQFMLPEETRTLL